MVYTVWGFYFSKSVEAKEFNLSCELRAKLLLNLPYLLKKMLLAACFLLHSTAIKEGKRQVASGKKQKASIFR